MFNFMLVVFGVFAAGIVNALDKDLPTGAIAWLCIFASILAVIFVLLDWRNKSLVWLGEDVLVNLERQAIFGEGKKITGRFYKEIDFGILSRQILEEQRRAKLGPIGNFLRDVLLGKHRVLLPSIGGLIALFFLVLLLLILLRTPTP